MLYCSKPGEVAVQISLIAVRRHFRACGIGRYLMMVRLTYITLLSNGNSIPTHTEHEGLFNDRTVRCIAVLC